MDKAFFSGSNPNLLNEKALKNFNIFLEESIIEPKTTGEHIITLYKEYVRPNLFGIFVLLIVCFFLFIRYLIKKYNANEKNYDDYEKSPTTNTNSDSDNITLSSYNEKNNDDLTDVDDKSRFTELNEEYNKAVKANIGNISEQALKDIYKKKKDKFSFDELTRIIVEGM